MAAHNARPVRCIDTGHVFPSVTAAAQFHGMDRNSIINNIRGKTEYCAGYRWEYADGKPVIPYNPNNLRGQPRMTIEDVQKEAERRSRETGRRVKYADIQIEETVAMIRARDKLAELKKKG